VVQSNPCVAEPLQPELHGSALVHWRLGTGGCVLAILMRAFALMIVVAWVM
jgi:hypothetical protein